MLYRVEISGKNYLDRTFTSLKDAQMYTAECGFSEYAGNVNNGNTINSQTYFYIAKNDNLENYPLGYEPCIIEEFEEEE